MRWENEPQASALWSVPDTRKNGGKRAEATRPELSLGKVLSRRSFDLGKMTAKVGISDRSDGWGKEARNIVSEDSGREVEKESKAGEGLNTLAELGVSRWYAGELENAERIRLRERSV